MAIRGGNYLVDFLLAVVQKAGEMLQCTLGLKFSYSSLLSEKFAIFQIREICNILSTRMNVKTSNPGCTGAFPQPSEPQQGKNQQGSCLLELPSNLFKSSLLGGCVVPVQYYSRQPTASAGSDWEWPGAHGHHPLVKVATHGHHRQHRNDDQICIRGEFQTQKEAAWAISNLTISGNKTQVSSLFGGSCTGWLIFKVQTQNPVTEAASVIRVYNTMYMRVTLSGCLPCDTGSHSTLLQVRFCYSTFCEVAALAK